jgi:catechol 2,3-dioxygenase-like lactoylglutathione lyase family enzyme
MNSAGGNDVVSVRLGLLVLYCSDLEACVEFYRGLGLALERERHGGGAEHYAAVLDEGVVFELYPGTAGATGSMRVGLTIVRDGVWAGPDHEGGVLRDPEGRVVDLCVVRRQ